MKRVVVAVIFLLTLCSCFDSTQYKSKTEKELLFGDHAASIIEGGTLSGLSE